MSNETADRTIQSILYQMKQQIALFNQFYLSILKVIYNIGTEILYFQCFVTTDMFLFSKSIIPEEIKS